MSVNHAYPRINGRSFIANSKGNVIKRLFPWQTIKVVSIKIKELEKDSNAILTRRPSVYQGLLE